jgi:hypothetical protein
MIMMLMMMLMMMMMMIMMMMIMMMMIMTPLPGCLFKHFVPQLFSCRNLLLKMHDDGDVDGNDDDDDDDDDVVPSLHGLD